MRGFNDLSFSGEKIPMNSGTPRDKQYLGLWVLDASGEYWKRELADDVNNV